MTMRWMLPGLGERGGKVDQRDRGTERRHQLLERRLGFGVGLVPDRRAHESEMRGCRRTFALHGAEIGAGERPRVRVGGVVAGEDVEDEREIGQRAREGTDMVEPARELQHARARHEPVASA